MRILSLAVFLAITTPTMGRPATAQTLVEERWRRVEPVIAELLRRPDVAGMSITVIDDFEITVSRAYGVRTTASRAPMTPNTLVQAASLSKVATATAALRLVERGTLALDEDVNSRLTSWKLPENEPTATARVTLRGLLSHTAGVAVGGFQGYPSGAEVPSALQILRGAAPANNAAIVVTEVPGPQRYSGGGYLVIQRLLEDATGRSFEQLMRGEVFVPAGMGRSVFALRPPPPLGPEVAEGHALQTSGELVEVTYQHPELAAGGLWSTSEDVAQLVSGLLRSWRGDRGQLLSPESVHGMMEPLGERRLGLGVVVREAEGGKGRYFMHTGSNVGFRSMLIGFLETGQGAVLMFNAEVDRIVPMELLAAIAREFGWPRFSLR